MISGVYHSLPTCSSILMLDSPKIVPLARILRWSKVCVLSFARHSLSTAASKSTKTGILTLSTAVLSFLCIKSGKQLPSYKEEEEHYTSKTIYPSLHKLVRKAKKSYLTVPSFYKVLCSCESAPHPFSNTWILRSFVQLTSPKCLIQY